MKVKIRMYCVATYHSGIGCNEQYCSRREFGPGLHVFGCMHCIRYYSLLR